MSDAIREAFEKWWLSRRSYRDSDKEAAYAGWQAALSANGGEAVADIDVDAEYRDFCEWLSGNMAFNVDYRLHTSSGNKPSVGGYIRDENARLMFAAWKEKAKRHTHPAPPSVAVPEIAVTALESARKSLATYGEHPIIEGYIAKAMKALTATPSVPENEVKARALEEFADWLKRQSFAHKKRWTSAANEALRCAARLRTAGDEEQ